jgi:hypothetical protein
LIGDEIMAKDAERAARKKTGERTGEVKPKQRMAFIKIRVPELKGELKKLQDEKKTLKLQLGADRAGRKGADAQEE